MSATRSTRSRRSTARHLAVLTTASVVCAAFGAPAAAAQPAPPTTPVPGPADPDQPPAAEPPPHPSVVGEAGAMLGGVRILPRTVTSDTIMNDPEFEETLPKQSVAEIGFGITSATANSEAFLAAERAKARSAPVALGLGGRSPRLPGTVVQAAVPDNAHPEVTGLRTPEQARDGLDAAGLSGRAHARWSEQRGPCVDPIADARFSLAQAAAVNELPAPQGGDPRLQDLGGLLNASSGPLVHIPDVAHSRSTVRLVDNPAGPGKAVRSTSRINLGSLQLFAGTDREIGVHVVHRPELSVTSTGDPSETTVDYKAPVLRITRGGEDIAELDAANPSVELPIGPAPRSGSDLPPLDLGVLRLSIGELREGVMDDGQAGAAAKLLDLRVLPHLPADRAALAQITIGEQIVRAKAPQGGVRCGDGSPAPEPTAVGDGAAERGPDGGGSSTPPGPAPEPADAPEPGVAEPGVAEPGDASGTHRDEARNVETRGELRPGAFAAGSSGQRSSAASPAGNDASAPAPVFWGGVGLLVLSTGLVLALRPRRR